MATTAYERIHPLELIDVATDDVAGDNSPDQFNHAVDDAADAVDGNHGIGIVSVSWLAADLPRRESRVPTFRNKATRRLGGLCGLRPS